MRVFIAIELPPHVKEELSALVDRLRGSGARASWVEPNAMHLTLRFLGRLDEEQLGRLRLLLADAYADARAFELRIAGIGCFPNARRPNVVWAGIVSSSGELASLQSVTESAAQAVGLPPETKSFHPHVTVARLKDPQQGRLLVPCLTREDALEGKPFAVTGVILFQSQLKPQGPIHTPLQEFRFHDA